LARQGALVRDAQNIFGAELISSSPEFNTSTDENFIYNRFTAESQNILSNDDTTNRIKRGTIQLLDQLRNFSRQNPGNETEINRLINDLARVLVEQPILNIDNFDPNDADSISGLQTFMQVFGNSDVSQYFEQNNIVVKISEFLAQAGEDAFTSQQTLLTLRSMEESMKIINSITDSSKLDKYNNSLLNVFTILRDHKDVTIFEDINKQINSINQQTKRMTEDFSQDIWEDAAYQSIDAQVNQLDDLANQVSHLHDRAVTMLNNNDIQDLSMEHIIGVYNQLSKIASASSFVSDSLIGIINTNKQLTQNEKQKLIDKCKRLSMQNNNILSAKFTDMLNNRISQRLTEITANKHNNLRQISNISGMGQALNSSIQSSGQAATSLAQATYTYKETQKERPIFSFGLSSSMKKLHDHAAFFSQLEMEYNQASATIDKIHTQAEKAFAEGNFEKGQILMDAYKKQMGSLVHLVEQMGYQAEAMSNTYNSLSKKQKDSLSPEFRNHMQTVIRSQSESSRNILVQVESLGLNVDTRKLRHFSQLADQFEEYNKELDKHKDKPNNYLQSIRNAYNEARGIIHSIQSFHRNIFNTFGLGSISLGPISVSRETFNYHVEQGRKRYASMSADAFIDVNDLNASARLAQEQMLASNELYRISGGRISQYAIRDSYENMVRNMGAAPGISPEQRSADMDFFAKNTVLLQQVYGIDQSTITNGLKTFYVDMRMSADQAANAFAKLTQQAIASNVPIDQYLSTFNELAKQYMTIGITGDRAGIVLDKLARNHLRIDIAKEVASQLGQAMSKFSQDKNKVAFAAVRLGEDPFHAIAKMAYTHDAKGDPRDEWIDDATKYADSLVDAYAPIAGDNEDIRRMIYTDLYKSTFGFSNRSASILIDELFKNGNTSQFKELFKKELAKVNNPNATLEDLNAEALRHLTKMAGILSQADHTEAELKSHLFEQAQHFGSIVDDLLQAFAPLLMTIQGLILEVSSKIVDWLKEIVSSDLFTQGIEHITEALKNLPVLFGAFFGFIFLRKISTLVFSLARAVLGPAAGLLSVILKNPRISIPLAGLATLAGIITNKDSIIESIKDFKLPSLNIGDINLDNIKIDDIAKKFSFFNKSDEKDSESPTKIKDSVFDSISKSIDDIHILDDTNIFDKDNIKHLKEKITNIGAAATDFRYQLYAENTDRKDIQLIRSLTDQSYEYNDENEDNNEFDTDKYINNATEIIQSYQQPVKTIDDKQTTSKSKENTADTIVMGISETINTNKEYNNAEQINTNIINQQTINDERINKTDITNQNKVNTVKTNLENINNKLTSNNEEFNNTYNVNKIANNEYINNDKITKEKNIYQLDNEYNTTEANIKLLNSELITNKLTNIDEAINKLIQAKLINKTEHDIQQFDKGMYNRRDSINNKKEYANKSIIINDKQLIDKYTQILLSQYDKFLIQTDNKNYTSNVQTIKNDINSRYKLTNNIDIYKNALIKTQDQKITPDTNKQKITPDTDKQKTIQSNNDINTTELTINIPSFNEYNFNQLNFSDLNANLLDSFILPKDNTLKKDISVDEDETHVIKEDSTLLQKDLNTTIITESAATEIISNSLASNEIINNDTLLPESTIELTKDIDKDIDTNINKDIINDQSEQQLIQISQQNNITNESTINKSVTNESTTNESTINESTINESIILGQSTAINNNINNIYSQQETNDLINQNTVNTIDSNQYTTDINDIVINNQYISNNTNEIDQHTSVNQSQVSYNTNITKLKKELHNLYNTKSDITTSINNINNNITTINEQLENTNKNDKDYESLINRLQNYDKQLEQLNKKLITTQSNIDETNKNIDTLHNQYKDDSTNNLDFEQITTKHNRYANKLKDDNEDINNKIQQDYQYTTDITQKTTSQAYNIAMSSINHADEQIVDKEMQVLTSADNAMQSLATGLIEKEQKKEKEKDKTNDEEKEIAEKEATATTEIQIVAGVSETISPTMDTDTSADTNTNIDANTNAKVETDMAAAEKTADAEATKIANAETTHSTSSSTSTTKDKQKQNESLAADDQKIAAQAPISPDELKVNENDSPEVKRYKQLVAESLQKDKEYKHKIAELENANSKLEKENKSQAQYIANKELESGDGENKAVINAQTHGIKQPDISRSMGDFRQDEEKISRRNKVKTHANKYLENTHIYHPAGMYDFTSKVKIPPPKESEMTITKIIQSIKDSVKVTPTQKIYSPIAGSALDKQSPYAPVPINYSQHKFNIPNVLPTLKPENIKNVKSNYGSWDFNQVKTFETTSISNTSYGTYYKDKFTPSEKSQETIEREKRAEEEREHRKQAINQYTADNQFFNIRYGQHKDTTYKIAGTTQEEIRNILSKYTSLPKKDTPDYEEVRKQAMQQINYNDWSKTASKIEVNMGIGFNKYKPIEKTPEIIEREKKLKIQELQQEKQRLQNMKTSTSWTGYTFGLSESERNTQIKLIDKELERLGVTNTNTSEKSNIVNIEEHINEFNKILAATKQEIITPKMHQLEDANIYNKREQKLKDKYTYIDEEDEEKAEEETKDESDQSRDKYAKKFTKRVMNEQYKAQLLAKSTYELLLDFMDLDNSLFNDLEKSIVDGHLQLLYMNNVTNNILKLITTSINRAGDIITKIIQSKGGISGTRSIPGGTQTGGDVQFKNTGNKLGDIGTFAYYWTKQKYGKDLPAFFTRAILRNEAGINLDASGFARDLHNYGGMKYEKWMAEYGVTEFRDEKVPEGKLGLAKFPDDETFVKVWTELYMGPQAYSAYSEAAALAAQGKFREAAEKHAFMYVAGGNPEQWQNNHPNDNYEQIVSNIEQIIKEEFERNNEFGENGLTYQYVPTSNAPTTGKMDITNNPEYYIDLSSGQITNTSPDTQRFIYAVANAWHEMHPELDPLEITSTLRHGDGSSYHDHGAAFDVANAYFDDKQLRVDYVNLIESLGGTPLDEWEGEPGAVYAHGNNIHATTPNAKSVEGGQFNAPTAVAGAVMFINENTNTDVNTGADTDTDTGANANANANTNTNADLTKSAATSSSELIELDNNEQAAKEVIPTIVMGNTALLTDINNNKQYSINDNERNNIYKYMYYRILSPLLNTHMDLSQFNISKQNNKDFLLDTNHMNLIDISTKTIPINNPLNLSNNQIIKTINTGLNIKNNTDIIPAINTTYNSYINKDYMNKDYMNKDYMNKDYMNKDYINKDYINKDYINDITINSDINTDININNNIENIAKINAGVNNISKFNNITFNLSQEYSQLLQLMLSLYHINDTININTQINNIDENNNIDKNNNDINENNIYQLINIQNNYLHDSIINKNNINQLNINQPNINQSNVINISKSDIDKNTYMNINIPFIQDLITNYNTIMQEKTVSTDKIVQSYSTQKEKAINNQLINEQLDYDISKAQLISAGINDKLIFSQNKNIQQSIEKIKQYKNKLKQLIKTQNNKQIQWKKTNIKNRTKAKQISNALNIEYMITQLYNKDLNNKNLVNELSGILLSKDNNTLLSISELSSIPELSSISELPQLSQLIELISNPIILQTTKIISQSLNNQINKYNQKDINKTINNDNIYLNDIDEEKLLDNAMFNILESSDISRLLHISTKLLSIPLLNMQNIIKSNKNINIQKSKPYVNTQNTLRKILHKLFTYPITNQQSSNNISLLTQQFFNILKQHNIQIDQSNINEIDNISFNDLINDNMQITKSLIKSISKVLLTNINKNIIEDNTIEINQPTQLNIDNVLVQYDQSNQSNQSNINTTVLNQFLNIIKTIPEKIDNINIQKLMQLMQRKNITNINSQKKITNNIIKQINSLMQYFTNDKTISNQLINNESIIKSESTINKIEQLDKADINIQLLSNLSNIFNSLSSVNIQDIFKQKFDNNTSSINFTSQIINILNEYNKLLNSNITTISESTTEPTIEVEEDINQNTDIDQNVDINQNADDNINILETLVLGNNEKQNDIINMNINTNIDTSTNATTDNNLLSVINQFTNIMSPYEINLQTIIDNIKKTIIKQAINTTDENKIINKNNTIITLVEDEQNDLNNISQKSDITVINTTDTNNYNYNSQSLYNTDYINQFYNNLNKYISIDKDININKINEFNITSSIRNKSNKSSNIMKTGNLLKAAGINQFNKLPDNVMLFNFPAIINNQYTFNNTLLSNKPIHINESNTSILNVNNKSLNKFVNESTASPENIKSQIKYNDFNNNRTLSSLMNLDTKQQISPARTVEPTIINNQLEQETKKMQEQTEMDKITNAIEDKSTIDKITTTYNKTIKIIQNESVARIKTLAKNMQESLKDFVANYKRKHPSASKSELEQVKQQFVYRNVNIPVTITAVNDDLLAKIKQLCNEQFTEYGEIQEQLAKIMKDYYDQAKTKHIFDEYRNKVARPQENIEYPTDDKSDINNVPDQYI